MIVVGGENSKAVEVLDTSSKQWYTAQPLPTNERRPSLEVIQDTMYIAGSESVVSASIPALIADAMSQNETGASDSSCTLWKQLPAPLFNRPALTSYHGNLLALSAPNDNFSSTVAMYLPLTKQWLPVAALNLQCKHMVPPFSMQAVIFSRDSKVIVAGKGKIF